MKNRPNTKFLCAFLLIALNFSLKAQFTFDNQTACKVEIQYEMYKMNGTVCNVCASGPITINANSSVTISGCTGWADICVSVTKIQGVALTGYNHANLLGNCHTLGIVGQSGNTGGCIWNASFNGTSTWQIQ